MMRAVTFAESGGPEVLILDETPPPIRSNSELLIRVVAAGVNPIDATTRSGDGVFRALPAMPAIPGYDFSGVVLEAPYESHPLQPGTEVFGMVNVPHTGGSYAEFVVASSLSVIKKPSTLSHVEAAAVPLAALTAWGMVVETAKAHEGQRMLVHGGSGGVGHFAVQFASYFGAHVIATGSSRNLGWLSELGARETVDYRANRFEEVVNQVDAVIDLVGNSRDATSSRSLDVLRPGGIIVSSDTESWPTMLDEAGRAGVRATSYRVAPDGALLAVIARLLESGDIRVFVDQVFELDQACEAHQQIETGHTRGKIVIRVGES